MEHKKGRLRDEHGSITPVHGQYAGCIEVGSVTYTDCCNMADHEIIVTAHRDMRRRSMALFDVNFQHEIHNTKDSPV